MGIAWAYIMAAALVGAAPVAELQSGFVHLRPIDQQSTFPGERLWVVAADSRPSLKRGASLIGALGRGLWLVDVAHQPLADLGITYAAPYLPQHKLSAAASLSDTWEVVLSAPAAAQALAVAWPRRWPDLTIVDSLPGPPARLIVRLSKADPARALSLARDHRVLWVDRYRPLRWLNADSVGPVQANAPSGGVPPTATPIWDQGLIGTGQIVAVADSGLDRNEAWFSQWHDGSGVINQITDAEDTTPPQIGSVFPARKVVAYWVMPDATAYDNPAACGGVGYHGTHVTGTVAGDRGLAATATAENYDLGDGMAPQAQILFQDLGDVASGCLSGQGGPPMWAQAKTGGALIHSNSYGADTSGNYTASDAAVDEFLWRNEDMLIAFAAGNDGFSGAMTIAHPGHAKHVLTVGASNHGDNATIAGFSSRGPASDGRIKPDLVAPGASIVSAGGDSNNATTDATTTNIISGTSMATPTVAGAAALARQYFTDGFYPTGAALGDDRLQPLGPLLKAVLLNGTRTYADTPAFNSGWGRVWLDSNLYFAGDDRQLRVWSVPNEAGLSQGESAIYTVQVPAGESFRATLVWYDPPPLLPATTALLNDLDLTVQAPADTYLGNVFSGGASTTGGSADGTNPVEQVYLPAPSAGLYTLTVNATAVAGNGEAASTRQGYALVVSAAQCDSAVVSVGDFSLTTDGSGVHASIDAVAGASAYQLYRTLGNCGVAGDQFQLARSGSTSQTDTTTQGGFEYAYRMRAVDACGEGPVSVCHSIVSQAPCTLSPEFDTTSVEISPFGDYCGARVSWTQAVAACPMAGLSYRVYRSTDPFFTPAPANLIGEVEGSLSDYSATPGQTYYYRVQAVDSLGNTSTLSDAMAYAPIIQASQPGTYFDGAESLALATMVPPWQPSPTAASGARSYYNAVPGVGYEPNTCAALTTPPINLQAGSPQLSYQARWELESEFDGVVVEISTDGGQNWQDLPPDGGYPGSFAQTASPPINACGLAASRGAFSGSSAGLYQGFNRDLSAYAGMSVQIRWLFSSDPGVELEGFFVDDITVTLASQPLACSAGDLFYRDGFEP